MMPYSMTSLGGRGHVGDSFEYRNQAFSPKMTQNLKGTIGYRVPLTSGLSIWGSAGVGERWQENRARRFPNYLARVEALPISCKP
jgi:hypothetical protein